MTRKLFLTATLIVLNIVYAFGQKPRMSPTPKTLPSPAMIAVPMPTPTPPTLETIISEAEKQSVNYLEEFKNLLATEIKTFESFDKKGKSKKQTVIESNFIVYQSLKDAAQVAEYRNVVKVDGKAVGDSDKRATDLFENLAKSASPETEFEDIQKESSRYDKTLNISGFTLNQVPIFADHIRPFFDFRLEGEENVGGSEVYVVSYQQKSKSPFVIFNDDQPKTDKLYISYDVDLPAAIKEPNALMRGKIYIDKQSFQIRRERRELTIQPAGLTSPLVVNETELAYQPSEVGILTPKRIVFTDYNVKVKDKGKDVSAIMDSKAIFEYDKFTKSEVDVKSGDVKN